MNDSDLLRRFAEGHADDAFAELVRRRIGLVYSAALRQVGGDAYRAEDITRANVADTVSRMDDASAYHRLINIARELAKEASFPEAIRIYNQAMAIKPAALEVTPEIRQLQTDLQAQSTPVDVTLASDGLTWASITNQHQPAKFTTRTVKLLPGNYQVIGRRKGFRDVGIDLVVRSGKPVGTILVVCTDSLDG